MNVKVVRYMAKRLSDFLKEKRTAAGLTQAEVADKLG